MASSEIHIKYDGGDADRNSIDAKLLGQSLQGIDRMVSDCVIVLSTQRMPKRGERAPLVLKVREPKAGSYDLPALVQEVSTQLGMGLPILQAVGPEIISHYVKATLDFFGGNQKEANQAIERMAEMHRLALENLTKANTDLHDTVRAMEDDRHGEQMAMISLLHHAVAGSGQAAVGYVAPVGQSVDTASFYAGEAPALEVRKDLADAIRDSQKLDWSRPDELSVETDGFKYHTSGLSIKNPDREGFMMADVADPAFEDEGNPYTVAAQRRARIVVLARRGYQNGQLAKIQILDFVRELDGPT